jgi:DNA integrity scanning protein DisA with diadenylate cyclase activity
MTLYRLFARQHGALIVMLRQTTCAITSLGVRLNAKVTPELLRKFFTRRRCMTAQPSSSAAKLSPRPA